MSFTVYWVMSMIPNLKDFLLRSCAEEHSYLIEQADRLLTRLGVVLHYNALENVLSLESETDSATLVHAIDDIYYRILDDALTEHGFVLQTDKLNDLVELMSGVLEIQNYEDRLTILNTLRSDLDPIEKFSELLSLVTESDATHYQSIITYMNPRTLDLLEQLLGDTDLLDVGTDGVEHDIKDRSLAFIKQYPDTPMVSWLTNGLKLGLPVNSYIDQFTAEQLDSLQKDYRLTALWLLGVVSLSDTPNTQMTTTIHELFDDYLVDLPTITKADQHLLDILGVLTRG